MLDYIVGRPSQSWRRKEIITVIFFSIWCILSGKPNTSRLFGLRRLNKALNGFAPWQIVLATLTAVYATFSLDTLLGIEGPDANTHSYLYSPSYNRAIWIVTGLDAGFASAMSIRPKWLKDICAILFSVYYILNTSRADAKLRRYRDACSVDFLRETWDKTSNRYIRAFTHHHRPRLAMVRKLLVPRPKHSRYTRPITVWLFFAGKDANGVVTSDALARSSQLVLDCPGGGFVAMSPEHHEERLRMWAQQTGCPIIAVDYGKAPDYPYPYAIDECFDAYCAIVESCGRVIGMNMDFPGYKPRDGVDIILSGDSAGGNIAVNVMFRILESEREIRRPIAMALTYAALNFSFTSWSYPTRGYDIDGKPGKIDDQALDHVYLESAELGDIHIRTIYENDSDEQFDGDAKQENGAAQYDSDRESMEIATRWELLGSRDVVEECATRSLFDRYTAEKAGGSNGKPTVANGKRLAMTSKSGYLHDRIITPAMMWAMTISYLGGRWEAGMETDYHVSPIFAPDSLLREFPAMVMQCGGRDPLSDDTVVFARRVAAAKGQGRAEETLVEVYPEWSHGYQQMGSLLSGAKQSISRLGGWLTARFRAEPDRSGDTASVV